MKEYEAEWMVYKKVMEDVIKRSGLNKNLFYDLRGNHDNFGVPKLDGLFDFYSRYSINTQLGRSGQVNSVTVEVSHFLRFLNSENTTHNSSVAQFWNYIKFENMTSWTALKS